MMKPAVEGGIPAFREHELDELVPKWPIAHPETDQKLLDIFHSGKWGGCGPYEQKLMTEFAAFQDCKYAVWMCNGTTTLECALLALGIGPGDEVIVPGVSWLATAQAPLYVGARSVIVDIDPETLCIDPVRIEEAITPRTRCIIPVHLFSAVADMDRINAIARKHDLVVVEDCAHAHGAKQHGRGTGSLGEFGSFSFQLSKLMTAGEGGCLTTNDEQLADRAFRASHIGDSKLCPKKPLAPDLMCHQYRFTEFQAAIIYDQLQHQAEFRSRHQHGAEVIRGILDNVPGIRFQKSSFEDDLRDYYFFAMLLQTEQLKPGIGIADVFKAMRAEGVGIQYLNEGWGAPLYKEAVWNVPQELYVKHDTSVCEDVMFNRFMCAPHRLLLASDSTLERWAEALKKVLLAYAS